MAKDKNKEKGVSLIITFFIMIIILTVVLSISVLLYGEVKVAKNIGNSVVGLYAAESGIEKVLYYDRQVLPVLSAGGDCSTLTCPKGQFCVNNVCTEYGTRGLCSIPASCTNIGSGDSSVYCNSAVSDNDAGCADCTSCSVSFNTTFDNRTYSVAASVSPSHSLDITSAGVFGGVSRQIETFVGMVQSSQPAAIIIKNACAAPKSSPQGTTIAISANVGTTFPNDTIGSVVANIYDSKGNLMPGGSNLSLRLINGTYAFGTWAGGWPTTVNTPAQAYYVDIIAKDTANPINEQKQVDIQSYLGCVTPQF